MRQCLEIIEEIVNWGPMCYSPAARGWPLAAFHLQVPSPSHEAPEFKLLAAIMTLLGFKFGLGS
jgi:hypothetical protein